MTRALGVAMALVVAGEMGAGSAYAQGTLGEAAERSRVAWRAGDVGALLAGSDTVQVSLPGASPSAPMRSDQARRLLERHLQGAEERELTVVAVREVGAGRGYAEMERHYVISRSRDERCETVYLGFRWAAGRWVVSEVRIPA